MAKQKKEHFYEKNIRRIEDILVLLNDEQLPLNEALTLHVEAMKLIAENEAYLQNSTQEFKTLE